MDGVQLRGFSTDTDGRNYQVLLDIKSHSSNQREWILAGAQNTYVIEIPQCVPIKMRDKSIKLTRDYNQKSKGQKLHFSVNLPASSAADWKSATPTRVIVGAMVNGPMKRRRNPIRPVKPITISNKEETIMTPCI